MSPSESAQNWVICSWDLLCATNTRNVWGACKTVNAHAVLAKAFELHSWTSGAKWEISNETRGSYKCCWTVGMHIFLHLQKNSQYIVSIHLSWEKLPVPCSNCSSPTLSTKNHWREIVSIWSYFQSCGLCALLAFAMRCKAVATFTASRISKWSFGNGCFMLHIFTHQTRLGKIPHQPMT